MTKDGVVKKNPSSIHDLPSKEDFRDYVEVQYEGRYNMFDPNARALTGLDKETYMKIIEHYGELAKMYPDVIDAVKRQQGYE